MAESSSTSNSGPGNSGPGTTSTSNSGPGNSGPGTTSTSNSGPGNSGPGNSGPGNGNNGVGPGLSFGAGINGPSIGLPGSLPGLTPGFIGFASSNFGQGWGDGSDGSSTNGNKTEPVMTVDEVYGKGNQSIVENQGDYEASSNEKSNVETSTFGKQDEISVTPLSVTEDKGLVNNDAIQSVEGLDFQQKDKANQEVMEAKKSRDDAEAEDNANGMRNQLKAVAEKDAEEDNNAFQVGDRDEDLAKAESDLSVKNKAVADIKKEIINIQEEQNKLGDWEIINKNVDQAEAKKDDVWTKKDVAEETLADLEARAEQLKGLNIVQRSFMNVSPEFTRSKANLAELAESCGIDIDLSKADVTMYAEAVNKVAPQIRGYFKDKAEEAESQLVQAHEVLAKWESFETDILNAKGRLEEAEKNQVDAQKHYDSLVSESFVDEGADSDAKAKAEETVTTETPSYKANIASARDEINNSKDLSPEQKSEVNTVLGNVESAADAMNEAANNLAANPNDINAAQKYVEETARYSKALKEAKGNKTLKNTDFNKTFTRAVAAANDFMVTREDGTQQNYAEFAAEMATKSPELAKGLYLAKAKNYEENGHKVLAAIENAKSKMVMTWLGSKFTFADNQVRNQFNQMAKTDMRATYATYNNVLNDPNATPEAKAEASAALNQANSLMVASTALQASTGFWSGIGDGTSDGVYGKTDPGDLNSYQKALNTASSFAKIALGLGVTPGANEAYQNMYYMAGAKVNESGLFSKDFDSDGFALCQEYGNNSAVGMIVGAGELATGVALMFNPATSKLGLNLTIDSVQTFLDGLYGVQKEVNKSIKYSSEVLNYFNGAKSIAAETGNKEAIGTIDSAIKQIEDFQLKSDEVGKLDNWLEGSGSNTADNGKFNQALSYDEWLKLIEADPVMREYAKSLNR